MIINLLDLKNESVGSNLNKTSLWIKMEFKYNLTFQSESIILQYIKNFISAQRMMFDVLMWIQDKQSESLQVWLMGMLR